MMNPVKQYLEEPGPTIRSQLEPMKGLPGLQVRLLHQVFRIPGVPDHTQRGPVEVSEMGDSR
jgi:hypothetical protein